MGTDSTNSSSRRWRDEGCGRTTSNITYPPIHLPPLRHLSSTFGITPDTAGTKRGYSKPTENQKDKNQAQESEEISERGKQRRLNFGVEDDLGMNNHLSGQPTANAYGQLNAGVPYWVPRLLFQSLYVLPFFFSF